MGNSIMSFPTILEPGYFVTYSQQTEETSNYSHTFCGPHNIQGAQCPNCNKPLLRFLAIDTSDPRMAKIDTDIETISFFYCWTCNIAQGSILNNKEFEISDRIAFRRDELGIIHPICLANGSTVAPFYYQINSSDNISLLQYCKKGAVTDFPYDDYPVYFPPATAQLMEITDEIQSLLNRLNLEHDDFDWSEYPEEYYEYSWPKHQIGGIPYLLQKNTTYRMLCPMCDSLMPFLASIDNDCLDERGLIGNNTFVQVLYHYCISCHIVGAFQQAE